MIHILYETGQTDVPETIKDRNGEVVLNLCRICGKAEGELDGLCLYSTDKEKRSARKK